MEFCSRPIGPIDLTITGCRKGCGYHPTCRETYTGGLLVPEGFCPHAFHAVYPYLLSLLYDGTFIQSGFEREALIRCSSLDGATLIKVGVEFKRSRRLMNLIETVARWIRLPKDAIDKNVALEIVQTGTGCHLESGRVWTVRIPGPELCPASFFSLYPPLRRFLSSGRWPWQGGVICPDPKSNIVYAIGSSGNHPQPHSGENYLPDLTQYEVIPFSLTAKADACPEMRVGNLVDQLPEGICPWLFYTAVPYLMTFWGGGHFKWRQSLHDVAAQCPNPSGGVEFEVVVRPGESDRGRISITAVRGTCICGLTPRQEFIVVRSRTICIHLYVSLFPELVSHFQRSSPGDSGNKHIFPCPLATCSSGCMLRRKRS